MAQLRDIFTLRRVLRLFVTSIGLFILWLLFWPVAFSPLAWQPAPDPNGTGMFHKDNNLMQATKYEVATGPEAIALDARGHIYTSVEDGRIIRYQPNGESHVLTHTQGRPLGMKFDRAGNLIIADGRKGLLQLAPDGSLEVLLDKIDGTPILFANDLDIDEAGYIYFSDSSTRYDYNKGNTEFLESIPSGRLIKFNPQNGTADILVENLGFANGVALAQDARFVLVNETMRYRITRYWLKGEKAGTSDIFIDNLPGFPDNITRAPDGGFWLALVAERNADFDMMMPRPFLRKLFYRFSLLREIDNPPTPVRAVKLNANGDVERTFYDASGHINMLSSVIEHENALYLGSLNTPFYARFLLPVME